MNKKLLIGIIVIIILISTYSYVNQTASPEDNEINDITEENIVILHATITDKTTGEYIEDAIVFLGATGASGKCYTNNKGECSIKDISWGDYAFGVFKEGYNRYTEDNHFEKGGNYITIELEKKSEIPTTLTIEGTIIEIITAEGTRSENHYYKIKDDAGIEEYLFNEVGVNIGFEEFVNKKVSITGFKETGFIGWQGQQVEGIYVKSIN